MQVDIKALGLDDVRAQLREFSDRRFSAAVATALTRTAVQARDAAKRALQAEIDRPTPYTVRALKYTPARADSLTASVGFDIEAVQDASGRAVGFRSVPGSTAASKYLGTQVDGGTRRSKRFELALQAKGAMPKGWIAVPAAGAHVDGYGNVSRGQIAQIIAQIGTELLSGYTNTPQSIKAKRAGQRRAGGQFIAVLPGARTKLKPGIYQRETIGSNLTPVFIYAKSATYRKRYDFDGAVRGVVDQRLNAELQQALDESAARLATRGTR
jgi:hypothetical protein